VKRVVPIVEVGGAKKIEILSKKRTIKLLLQWQWRQADMRAQIIG
jgi:hypothetical protein